eukprot:CAMPEP_0198145538 /NCGR_PEP_ID=MMETSP1443-20131203/24215_1 /TAXON_ID=186043 /ORGANISM="Entomoneis sp., Strain CCMP2396" /LENGTH=261 /DNA_ID=CAMNT_0043809225 /DNA_START=168 /DNA_END=950 /DNA_ORIENTATION=+
MHPLEQSIDIDFHRPRRVRRRSSLDNSCLASTESFAAFLDEDEITDFVKKERRLSWDTSMESTNTLFLAGIFASPGDQQKPVKDLDADRHSSSHHNSGHVVQLNRNGKPSSHSKASQPDTINTSSYSSEDGNVAAAANESSDSESTLDDSDCDSFCDASVGEPANRTYLCRDLGASVMWSDCESMDGISLQDSWDGGDASVDSPRGKPQRARSGSLPRSPQRTSQFSRPLLRHHSADSAESPFSSIADTLHQFRRGRRSIV